LLNGDFARLAGVHFRKFVRQRGYCRAKTSTPGKGAWYLNRQPYEDGLDAGIKGLYYVTMQQWVLFLVFLSGTVPLNAAVTIRRVTPTVASAYPHPAPVRVTSLPIQRSGQSYRIPARPIMRAKTTVLPKPTGSVPPGTTKSAGTNPHQRPSQRVPAVATWRGPMGLQRPVRLGVVPGNTFGQRRPIRLR
jgi:hypothetical protein